MREDDSAADPAARTDHAARPDRAASTDEPGEPPSLARLLVSTGLAVVTLVLGVAALGYWLRAPLMAVGGSFVERFGGPGVAIGFAVPDAFTIPVPNDTFLALGLAGGMSDSALIGWGTLGSLVGGSAGFGLGRLLRGTRRLQRFFRGRGAAIDQALRRHGVKIVAIAAVTPLPYSISAWAAGASTMRYRTFAAVSLLRVFRVMASLYLIRLGLAVSS